MSLKHSDDQNASTRVAELAVNLDDITAELIADAQQTLLDEGALDVWTVAIGMKKGRAGTMLCVLCLEEDRDTFARRILALTGSLGVRHRLWDRTVLDRKFVTVTTRFGQVRVKVGMLEGQGIVARAEFEDLRKIARQHGVSLREVATAAEAAIESYRRAEGAWP